MIGLLICVAALLLGIHIFFCSTYFISSIREKEKRATVFAGLQLAIASGFFGFVFYLRASDFFETKSGTVVLGVGVLLLVLMALLLVVKTSWSNKALEGARGLIVGSVQRFDERETVFVGIVKNVRSVVPRIRSRRRIKQRSTERCVGS